MKLPFAKMPQVHNDLAFRIINPRPVEFLISWDGPSGKACKRWVYFVQVRPYSMARPGNVRLLDMGFGLHNQIEELNKQLCQSADGSIRTHELCVECVGSHDRRLWKHVLHDMGPEAEFNWCQPNETDLFSFNSLMNVARHRIEATRGSQASPIRYLDIISKDDPDEIVGGASMDELFNPDRVEGPKGPTGPPGIPGPKGIQGPAGTPGRIAEPVPEQPKVLTVESVNVALYDARLAKSPRDVTEPLLEQWFKMTGRRAPKWW